jgi:hypothetical protein
MAQKLRQFGAFVAWHGAKLHRRLAWLELIPTKVEYGAFVPHFVLHCKRFDEVADEVRGADKDCEKVYDKGVETIFYEALAKAKSDGDRHIDILHVEVFEYFRDRFLDRKLVCLQKNFGLLRSFVRR